MEEINSAWIEMKAFFLKILMPALVAVSIKIAIQSKSKQVTVLQIIISFVTGIGSAYLFSGLILDTFSENYVPLYIAIVAISGEKIGQWLVYKLNVESILEGIVSKLKSK